MRHIFDDDMTEEQACVRVGEDFAPCAPCDPTRCDGRSNNNNVLPSRETEPLPEEASAGFLWAPAAQTSAAITYCGCPSCGQQAWDTLANEHSCGARVDYLLGKGSSMKDACHAVGGLEFNRDCGRCDPNTCQSGSPPQAQNQQDAPPQVESVAITAAVVKPVSSSYVESSRCGCSSCTESASPMADGHKCVDRIKFLFTTFANLYPTEQDACHQIAQVEFPLDCRVCDPGACNAPPAAAAPQPQYVLESSQIESWPEPQSAGLDARQIQLYCFPPYTTRNQYDNVWGAYTLQVKEGMNCGPSDNIFSADTVQLDNNGRDLKLQFKKVNNQWTASEVRVLLPPRERAFDYGSYSFSVKSVQVIDSQTGSIVSSVLPRSLVFGLFTWDPTENYDTHENWNHEVDVEISRWDDEANADVQFLVQPPGYPHKHRFFSGAGNTYQQARQVYGFDWAPGAIEWYSTAGGGQRFRYSVQDALAAQQPSYVQCMPAQVEVRLNLWNLHGASPPAGMQDSHVVEVVIDDFQFVPSAGPTFLPDGGTCANDCHCSPSSRCLANKCTATAGGTRGRRRGMTSQEETGADGTTTYAHTTSQLYGHAQLNVLIFVVLGSVFLLMAVLVIAWQTTKPDDHPYICT